MRRIAFLCFALLFGSGCASTYTRHVVVPRPRVDVGVHPGNVHVGSDFSATRALEAFFGPELKCYRQIGSANPIERTLYRDDGVQISGLSNGMYFKYIPHGKVDAINVTYDKQPVGVDGERGFWVPNHFDGARHMLIAEIGIYLDHELDRVPRDTVIVVRHKIVVFNQLRGQF